MADPDTSHLYVQQGEDPKDYQARIDAFSQDASPIIAAHAAKIGLPVEAWKPSDIQAMRATPAFKAAVEKSKRYKGLESLHNPNRPGDDVLSPLGGGAR